MTMIDNDHEERAFARFFAMARESDATVTQKVIDDISPKRLLEQQQQEQVDADYERSSAEL